MSDWKVSVEQIGLFPHPNADALELGKVGSYQVVVQKGLYKNGDTVAFAPEKSVLPSSIKEPWEKYLSGAEKNRVKPATLRGELSCGIIIPMETITNTIGRVPNIGEDISKEMGITQYIPPIPTSLSGQVKPFRDLINQIGGSHDCEQLRVYQDQYVQGERVVVTEKVHGSQCIITNDIETAEVTITSKGLRKAGLHLENNGNSYWVAYLNNRMVNIFLDVIAHHNPKTVVRMFGELVPCQKGYNYGHTNTKILLFDIRVDGHSIPYDQVPQSAKDTWVPVLYDGPFDMSVIAPMREGKEQVSGKELHIREGVVVAPYIDRKAFDGTRLRNKLINPSYKETDDAFN